MNEHFAARAAEFIERVRATSLDPSTEFVLVYHCVDQEERPVPPIKVPLEPTTKVRFEGSKDRREAAHLFAASLHRGTVEDNINSLVRDAPEGLTRLHDGPEHPVTIRDFSLEINQPDDLGGLVLQADPLPLREEPTGVLRVGKSRVLLELVIRAFQDGVPAEAIVQRYSTLALADVYAVIAFYLRHRPEVEAYLARRERKAEEVRQRIVEQQGDLAEIRSRLLVQRQG